MFHSDFKSEKKQACLEFKREGKKEEGKTTKFKPQLHRDTTQPKIFAWLRYTAIIFSIFLSQNSAFIISLLIFHLVFFCFDVRRALCGAHTR